MNDDALATNYIRAFEHLVSLIGDTDSAIRLATDNQDQLGLKQYSHLKRDYVQQLAELIGRAPQSVKLQATTY